jgi:hypothetical protein
MVRPVDSSVVQRLLSEGGRKMSRIVICTAVGLAVVAIEVQAEIEPLSRALSASASADGPPGVDTDQNSANSGAEFGSVGLSASASSYGPVPDFPDITDGTDAQATVDTNVLADSVSIAMSTNFVHGGPFDYSSSADGRADVTFVLSTATEKELRFSYDLLWAIASGSLDGPGGTVWTFDPLLGDPMGSAEDSVRLSLAAGQYTLSARLSTGPAAGTSGPGSFSVTLVPEPGMTTLALGSSLVLLARRRCRSALMPPP